MAEYNKGPGRRNGKWEGQSVVISRRDIVAKLAGRCSSAMLSS